MIKPDALQLIPFEKLGDFVFGDTPESVEQKLGVPKQRGDKFNSVDLFYYDFTDSEFIFRFDDKKLSQINISKPPAILYNEVDVADKNYTSKDHNTLVRKTLKVFTDIGITVSATMRGKRTEDIYIFDKNILKNWENIKRPITSW